MDEKATEVVEKESTVIEDMQTLLSMVDAFHAKHPDSTVAIGVSEDGKRYHVVDRGDHKVRAAIGYQINLRAITAAEQEKRASISTDLHGQNVSRLLSDARRQWEQGG